MMVLVMEKKKLDEEKMRWGLEWGEMEVVNDDGE